LQPAIFIRTGKLYIEDRFAFDQKEIHTIVIIVDFQNVYGNNNSYDDCLGIGELLNVFMTYFSI